MAGITATDDDGRPLFRPAGSLFEGRTGRMRVAASRHGGGGVRPAGGAGPRPGRDRGPQDPVPEAARQAEGLPGLSAAVVVPVVAPNVAEVAGLEGMEVDGVVDPL